MAEKIKKKISGLLMLFLFLLIVGQGFNLLVEKVKAETASTSVEVTNSTPTISSLQLHNGVNITLPEWAAGAGTYQASTTFRVTDGNGWTEISTTTIYVFRSGIGIASCAGSANSDINNCYPSTSSADSAWNPKGLDGVFCNRTATGTDWADFWCTTTLYYVAEPTDAGTYSAQTWTAYASTSDINWAQANSTYSTVEVITTQALAIDSTSITYPTLGAGTNSTSNWATTTATTTGNVAIDIHFYGTTMTGPGDAIAVGQQKLTTTTPATYGTGDFALLASPGKTHDLTMAKATTTSPGPTTADKVFWGIAIPSLQAAGSYTGTNTLTATSTIVNP